MLDNVEAARQRGFPYPFFDFVQRNSDGLLESFLAAFANDLTPASRDYLMLYYTVPGGTGYLKDLMTDRGELPRVFGLALESLKACGCNREPLKDGCYRCVYAYRRSRDMALTSRSTAVAILESILDHVQDLEAVEGLDKVKVNAVTQAAGVQPRSDTSRSYSARGIVTPLRSACSRSVNRRCPGSRVPGCSSIAARRSLQAGSEPSLRERPRVQGEQELACPRRRTLRLVVGARLEAEAGSRERAGQDLHHQGELGALGVADWRHRAGHGRPGVGRRVARSIERPARGDRLACLGCDVDSAARHLAEAHVDDERRMVGPWGREADRVGAEQPAAAAPRGDGLGSVADTHGDVAGPSERLDVMGDDPGMMRVADHGCRHRRAGEAVQKGALRQFDGGGRRIRPGRRSRRPIR